MFSIQILQNQQPFYVIGHLHCRTHDAVVLSLENLIGILTNAPGLGDLSTVVTGLISIFPMTFRLEVRPYAPFVDLVSPVLRSFCFNSHSFVRYSAMEIGLIFPIEILIFTSIFEFHVAHLWAFYCHTIC